MSFLRHCLIFISFVLPLAGQEIAYDRDLQEIRLSINRVHGETANGEGSGGGGGGGCAILLASDTKIEILGRIEARGGNGGIGLALGIGAQAGSGGAIRLVTPAVSGFGRLDASPGNPNGGLGRVRIDTSAYGPQTLQIQGAAGSIGANTVLFPSNVPDIRLTAIAGTAVDPEGMDAIVVNPPADNNPVQPVTIEAENFNSNVVFVVQVVPERGPTTTTEGTIDNTTTNPASTTLNVTFPLNASAQVFVWPKQLVASE